MYILRTLGLGLSSCLIDDKMSLPPNFLNALAFSKGKFIPAPDGVLIENTEGYTIGAIGISGDSSKKTNIAQLKL